MKTVSKRESQSAFAERLRRVKTEKWPLGLLAEGQYDLDENSFKTIV